MRAEYRRIGEKIYLLRGMYLENLVSICRKEFPESSLESIKIEFEDGNVENSVAIYLCVPKNTGTKN
ncbi:MAG: hypothetical protein AAB556_01755 [Patescibacteria group bacterium]